MEVYITHIEPGEVDAVMSEIGAHASRHRIHALVSGQVMTLGGGQLARPDSDPADPVAGVAA